MVPKNRKRVLIVDDTSDWRETLADLLSDDYMVLKASGYSEARSIIATKQFDIAVLDIRLDDNDQFNVDGLKLLKEIKEKSSDTAVIMLTGYASMLLDQNIVLKYEADALCLKVPKGGKFDIDEFNNTVKRLIAKSRGRILIVDDTMDWRETLADVLSENHDVIMADTYSAAKSLIEIESFDIAILDVRLEDEDQFNVDGLKLLRLIKEQKPQVGVIILTGYTQSFRQEIVLQHQADAIYYKVPIGGKFNVDDFTKMVGNLLQKRR